MRTVLLSFLGSLLALALAGAVVTVVVQQRGQLAQGQRRAALMRELGEYEAWYNEPGRQNRRFFDGNRGRSAYGEELRRFEVLHPEFSRYYAWWVETRRGEGSGSLVDETFIGVALPEHLRDPAMIDRYLAER